MPGSSFACPRPLPETIQKWDELTAAGQTVVAIGGSFAHAMTKHFGFFAVFFIRTI